jgi:predicted nuclease of predicted toxin-antitoxin system
MRFLVDAQLPRRLAEHLRQAGLSAIHTLDLPDRNRTTDLVINELSVKEQYVVVTKDSDFVESFLLVENLGNSCWLQQAILGTMN